MASPKNFTAPDADGVRFDFKGIATVYPLDSMPAGLYPYAQNVRAYQRGRLGARATESVPALTLGTGSSVYTLRRLNDTSLNGPASGFAYVLGSASSLWVNNASVVTGLSGNPLALVPFRPNTSVQPWMYCADANAMSKVRSDGLAYKMGIVEPQAAPVVGTQSTTVSGNLTVLGTARPWSNTSSQNPSYNYGDTGAGTGPAIIATATANATVTITATGSVTIAGTAYAPGTASGNGSTYPGHYLTGGGAAVALIGAFTDASGNVISQVATTDKDVVNVGASVTLLVPTNAVQLQLGIDAVGGTYSGNTGSFAVSYSVSTSAVATKVSLGGPVTAYYWGDSPHSGPVAEYIWQSTSDGHGSGPTRGISNASGSTMNNSLLFDQSPTGSPTTPVAWTVFNSSGVSTGTNPVFTPALETEGYSDFNMCIVGSLFIPAAGAYTFLLTYKDSVMWGIGNNASWSGIGTLTGNVGQTQTVVNGLPLLPAAVTSGGSSTPGTSSIAVTFPGPGLYPFEIDWDYWNHSGRTLVLTVNGQNIVPLTSDIKTNVQYRYVYRSSATGATSNPSPESVAEAIPVLANTLLATYSTDPQVDKIDFYRMDQGLDNFTYVATVNNTNPPTQVNDALLDIDVSGNPILEYDNFEPFPSLDLPRKGVVNVVGSVVQWVSGDLFNVRWLPGSIINIGGIAYTLDKRPTSTTNLTAGSVASGNGLVYELDAATLAAQPLPAMWGPTSEGSYMFGCRDPLRPGTIYWTKGNNPDSAPDTNQLELTSPSEPLINGCIANGLSLVFSAERSWVFYPTFTSALATVTGEEGSTWNPVLSPMTRGLYIPNCLAVSGGGAVFFRTKDGVSVSPGGGTEKSITDDVLYNLFAHEGAVPGTLTTPQSVTIAGYTIFPPDDTQPLAQQFSCATGYLYYDYLDTNNVHRTLVFDEEVGGWVIDVYGTPVAVHALEEGPKVNGTMVGCTDGTVRLLGVPGSPAETATCVVMTPALDAGEDRSFKQIGDIYLEATVASTAPVTIAAYQGRYTAQIGGISPAILTGTGGSATYIVDLAGGEQEVDNIAMSFSWTTGSVAGKTLLEFWRPSWIVLPETIVGRATDWSDGGYNGAKFVQGLRVEANTFSLPKTFAVQSGDDLSLHVPNECPATYANQAVQAFSFAPFIAHTLRTVSSDGVPWRQWDIDYLFQPYPELVRQFQTELRSYGPGWQTINEMNMAYIAGAPLNLVLTFDQWPAIVIPNILLPASPSQLYPIKTKLTIPTNKSKLMGFGITSPAPFRLFKDLIECKVGVWGRSGACVNVQPFGGASAEGAEV